MALSDLQSFSTGRDLARKTAVAKILQNIPLKDKYKRVPDILLKLGSIARLWKTLNTIEGTNANIWEAVQLASVLEK